jgi:hypothetical protein
VLKFVDRSYIYLVISGPDDDKLIKINDIAPFDVAVFDFFKLPVEQFDDLLYYSIATNTAVATNIKSVNNVNQMQYLDLDKFEKMGTEKERLELSALSTEDRKRLIEERNPAGDFLKVEDKAVLVKLRRGKTDNLEGIRFQDITLYEKNYIRRATNFPTLSVPYGVSDLFKPLILPTAPVFKFNAPSYIRGDLECLAAKIIPLTPGIARTIYRFKEAVPTNQDDLVARLYFYLAVLARRYENAKGDYTLQLYIFKYRKDDSSIGKGDTFRPIESHVITLTKPFMPKNTEDAIYSVKEMNLIFHTTSVFYVELMMERQNLRIGFASLSEFVMVGSELIDFGFKFPPLGLSRPLPAIQDAALFEEVKQRGYKIYDYRHNVVPDQVVKFDCIFYRYNYEKNNARFIFYKRGTRVASVADIYIADFKPLSIRAISPIRLQNGLCYFTIARTRNPQPLIVKIVMQHDFLLYDPTQFSLAASLQASLSLKEYPPFCVYCGEIEPKAKDLENGHLYCDDLCQRLYCTTNSL